MLIHYFAGYLMVLTLQYSCLNEFVLQNTTHGSVRNFKNVYLISNYSRIADSNKIPSVDVYSHLGKLMFTIVSPFLLALGGKVI